MRTFLILLSIVALAHCGLLDVLITKLEGTGEKVVHETHTTTGDEKAIEHEKKEEPKGKIDSERPSDVEEQSVSEIDTGVDGISDMDTGVVIRAKRWGCGCGGCDCCCCGPCATPDPNATPMPCNCGCGCCGCGWGK